MAVTATEFASFLSQAAEITRRQETRLADQTKGSGGFAYSESDLAAINGVRLGLTGDRDAALLTVDRPLDPPQRPHPEPHQPDRSEVSEAEWELYLAQRKEYEAAWSQFMEDQKRYRAQRDLYRDVFRARDEGDGKELVLGVVQLRSLKGTDDKIDRPIMVVDVLVELDEATGSLTVVPAGPQRNEVGWLPTEIRKQLRLAKPQAEAMEAATPYDLKDTIGALANRLGTDFVTEASQEGKYLLEVEYILAYRKQTANAISELMEGMVEAFTEGGSPTRAYQTLLDQDVSSSEPSGSRPDGLLPLASSSVQEEIVDHALNNPLTVVLGPPGTGKTHTIANTAAALIASGKRVLVTSERELPLLEVQEKLPETMQPLLLPIFGRGNVAALAKSSTGIQERHSRARRAQDRAAAIDELVQKLDGLKAEQVRLQRQLLDAASADGSPVTINGVERPLKGWVRLFRDDEHTPLFVDGGLLAEEGSVEQGLADELLERSNGLSQEHLIHAGYSFPQTLSDLTSAAELRRKAGPLQDTLSQLGQQKAPSLAGLVGRVEELDDISEELARCALPPVDIEAAPTQAALARSCTQASQVLGGEDEGPDLETASAIARAGFDLTTRAFRLLQGDATGYLERFVKEAPETRSGALRTLIDAARQHQFRPHPIHNVVENDGDHSPVKLLRQAEALRGHLESGGKFKTLLGVPKEVKAAEDMLASVCVDGERVSSKFLLALAIEHLEAEVDRFNAHRWASSNGFSGAQTEVQDWVEAVCDLPGDAQNIRQLLGAVFGSPAEWSDEPLEEVLSQKASEFETFIDSKIPPADQIGAKVLAQAQAELEAALECLPGAWQHHVTRNGLDLESLLIGLRALAVASTMEPGLLERIDPQSFRAIAGQSRDDHERQAARSALDAELAACRAPLAGLSHPSPGVEALLVALREEDLDAVDDAWTRIRNEHVLWAAGSEYHRAFAAVSEQYPELALALRSEDATQRDLARSVLGDIEQLQLRRAGYRQVIEVLEAMPNFDEVNGELQTLLTKRRHTEAELAEARCWHAALQRLEANPNALTGINAMKVAAQAVPKTKTAKSYPSKLQALRTAMTRALPGVPGVVMKLERCAELIGLPESDKKKFDVVIVDEASQSLFTSLFVFGLAESVIIVGDNYQTSPRVPFGALLGLQMTELALETIPEHPNVNQFSADFSLFDAALSWSQPFVMTEHFRCDPQIIELSNILCYDPNGHTLQPVKAPDPDNPTPVELHYVEDGTVDTEGINAPEVDSVISKVMEIVENEPDSTIGVVVVGSSPTAQVRELNQQILDLVGPDEAVKRRLEVGTAAAFQGAERDIVLISMVDSPSLEETMLKRKPHEFSGPNRYFVQDLNVAVSRAKRQLHIFHSFRSNELKDGDVRSVLLSAAKRRAADVTDEAELAKTDSQFERDVFSALRARLPDARIRSQVPAAGYQIDLVVESGGRQVAVECDGDRWHTSTEAVIRDTQRQRLLESLGWRFVRPLASQWYSPGADDYWIERIEQVLYDQGRGRG